MAKKAKEEEERKKIEDEERQRLLEKGLLVEDDKGKEGSKVFKYLFHVLTACMRGSLLIPSARVDIYINSKVKFVW